MMMVAWRNTLCISMGLLAFLLVRDTSALATTGAVQLSTDKVLEATRVETPQVHLGSTPAETWDRYMGNASTTVETGGNTRPNAAFELIQILHEPMTPEQRDAKLNAFAQEVARDPARKADVSTLQELEKRIHYLHSTLSVKALETAQRTS